MLPTCIQLASRIIAAGENVVANNARCTDLVQHVAFIERLLHRLQSALARCGFAGRCTCGYSHAGLPYRMLATGRQDDNPTLAANGLPCRKRFSTQHKQCTSLRCAPIYPHHGAASNLSQ
jgi:hypothetical protein